MYPAKIVTGSRRLSLSPLVRFRLCPPGIEMDGRTVFTSDHCRRWLRCLELGDVYTALGSEVPFIEDLNRLMPGFDSEIIGMFGTESFD